MYTLGIDLGSSSIKLSLFDVGNGVVVGSEQQPEEEMRIESPQPGWAEQDPSLWWHHMVNGMSLLKKKYPSAFAAIQAIGIAYQMHGLVAVDKNLNPVRSAIIWCDSRAVDAGDKLKQLLSPRVRLNHLLNAPGNFTAARVKWVKDNEPDTFNRIAYILLPGDYIAMRLTGEVSTTATGLSEAILWDFKSHGLSESMLEAMGVEKDIIPPLVPMIGEQGQLVKSVSEELGLAPGIKISYRAGDQPNNAFSLNVLDPGQFATTAGTSAVIYGVTDTYLCDPQNRINTFLHLNDKENRPRHGMLMCINGSGIAYQWMKRLLSVSSQVNYEQLNELAVKASEGSDDLYFFPFGNGSERILDNQKLNASLHNLDFNRHSSKHLIRATIEGIAFAMRYGFDRLGLLGMSAKVIRAGRANLFLSPLFKEIFVNTMDVPLELYETDGAAGAARGAALGCGAYNGLKQAFSTLALLEYFEPEKSRVARYGQIYDRWHSLLQNILNER